MNASFKSEVHVRLAEAGTVSLLIDIDLAKISTEDQEFVYGLFMILLERARHEAVAKRDKLELAFLDGLADAGPPAPTVPKEDTQAMAGCVQPNDGSGDAG